MVANAGTSVLLWISPCRFINSLRASFLWVDFEDSRRSVASRGTLYRIHQISPRKKGRLDPRSPRAMFTPFRGSLLRLSSIFLSLFSSHSWPSLGTYIDGIPNCARVQA